MHGVFHLSVSLDWEMSALPAAPALAARLAAGHAVAVRCFSVLRYCTVNAVSTVAPGGVIAVK